MIHNPRITHKTVYAAFFIILIIVGGYIYFSKDKTPTGYILFEDYAFSFIYPNTMTITKKPYQTGEEVDIYAGKITCSNSSSEILISWWIPDSSINTRYNFNEIDDDFMDSIDNDVRVEYCAQDEIIVNGHKAHLISYRNTVEYEPRYHTAILFHCDEYNEYFAFRFSSYSPDVDEIREHFVTNFKCH